MKKLLVVVDMQNDFIDGVLGTSDAVAIVPGVVRKIDTWDGDLAFTMDTHGDDYLLTNEGKHLPVIHCVKNTPGWEMNGEVKSAIQKRFPHASCYRKPAFGSLALAKDIAREAYLYIEFVGLCTDICVISNVMLAKAADPEAQIVVDASCCAGVSPASHHNSLEAMKVCHVEVINDFD